MLFQELPELSPSPKDNTQILVGDSGVLKRANNLYTEVLDAEMVRLVLTKQTPNSELDQHIADLTLHTRLNDSTVSPTSTWSSSRINTAILGSNPWFNLDSVPEGGVNKYFTTERGRELIAATTQGITSVDHQAVATQLISVLLGFNSSLFRYVPLTPPATPISVSVDGGTPTINELFCTPGSHNLFFTGYTGGSYSGGWVCEELAHKVNLSNGVKQVTPKLTLDAFAEGTTNKFWNTTNYANSNLVSGINNHLTTNFNNFHAPINDNSSANSATWSSNKIINFISSAIASNRAAIAATAKTVFLGHETAASGLNPTGYSWDTLQAGSVYTHHVSRVPQNQGYNTSGGGTVSGVTITIPPGTWLVYWEADMTLRAGIFANVTNPSTYIAAFATPRVPLLSTPGVITNSTTANATYRLVSRFSTTTAYNASFANNWLQPQSIAGVTELFATIQIERVR